MAKFLTGKDLEDVIYDIIWDAEKTLLIVSPFIKLDDYFKDLFERHLNNPKLKILLVFGKNARKVNKSLSNNDFEFFKQFPNVSIVYVPNLHAKYYGNEKKGVITSINLYDFSFKNNIEFGVFSEEKLIDKLSSKADNAAWNECIEMAKSNDVVYIKRPAYRNKKGLISFGKEYVNSQVLLDLTDKFYGSKNQNLQSDEKLDDFPFELDFDTMPRPERVWDDTENRKLHQENKVLKKELTRKGYCIRTGAEIEFNPEKPLSAKAFKMWNKFGDKNYQENYCHYSGEPSNGETSFAKPILRKNWRKANKIA